MHREKPGTAPGQRARGLFNTQIIFTTAFAFLTSGVFLSGFAIYLGASDLLVSYINIITNICGVSILLCTSVVERFQSFKRLALGFTLLSRGLTLLIVTIPLLVPAGAQMAVFIPLMVVAFTLQAQTTVVINNWMVSFVEERNSGRYISKRQTLVLVVTVALSFAGGRWLDASGSAYIGFLLLFAAAFVMSVAEIATLAHIPDAPQGKPQAASRRFGDIIRVPVKCKPFLQFILYIFVFYLLLSMADSFTVVYLMRYLALPYTTTTLLQMLISLPQIFLLAVWGKISDKKGHAFTLNLAIWFFVGETLFLALSNPGNLYVCIPVAFLFAALANAGFVISVFNRRYELMPKDNRILYDNFFSGAVGMAFLLGPLIGGFIKQAIESSLWLSQLLLFGNIRLLYALSALGILLLQCVVLLKSRR